MNMKKKGIVVAACAAVLLGACGTSRETAAGGKIGGEWSIVKVNGQEVKAADVENTPFIGFSEQDGRLYGSTSCNRLLGSFKADAKTGSIDLGNVGSTRMMCAKMDVEQKVLEALNKVKKYKVGAGGSLSLDDAAGKTLIELKKK